MPPLTLLSAALVGLTALGLARPLLAAEDRQPWVLLPEAQASAVVQQCSRAVPRITGSWVPTARDIRRLEQDLKTLRGRQAEACCAPKAHLDDPSQYFRQYAGVLREGQRVIYVNAFRRDPFAGSAQDWHKTPVILCDGDPGNWGVLYDPSTRRFFRLAFNGNG
jgi:hypothetical protein